MFIIENAPLFWHCTRYNKYISDYGPWLPNLPVRPVFQTTTSQVMRMRKS